MAVQACGTGRQTCRIPWPLGIYALQYQLRRGRPIYDALEMSSSIWDSWGQPFVPFADIALRKLMRYQKTLLFPQHNLTKKRHARKRRAAVGCLQLCQPGAASAAGPSFTFAACHDR